MGGTIFESKYGVTKLLVSEKYIIVRHCLGGFYVI